MPSSVPPVDASYQEIGSDEDAVSVTAPGPQFVPEVTEGGAVTIISAITGIRALLQPPLEDCA